MRRSLFIVIVLLAVLGLRAQSVYESGVSQLLAEHRARVIHDLSYDLHFVIPEDRHADIKSHLTLTFSLDAPEEIVLDFREAKERIHSVRKASATSDVSWRFENEHIVIPASATRKGQNAFDIDFTAGNQSLNRNEEYMYTLFVPDRARTCFPCFDQPDLKARFSLTLDIPADWTAVTNEPLRPLTETTTTRNGRKILTSRGTAGTAPRALIPTYLFAFAAGKFDVQEYTEDGRTVHAYYRETDYYRLQQLPEIFRQVMYSLRWQEDFTQYPYGFSKYDFVILPGFQFGGMEHTGCTFYNDNTLFLNDSPTPDEILSRANLIAHETSHMWFGDLVTMRWFNDVWTKEVFANYFAAEITRPLFPDVNHDLNWLKTFKAAALQEDRTEGRTAIQQPLDNMQNAGLIYNNIIYNKAPLVMREMVSSMGREAFRRGIQRYVKEYAYANATWDDLIDILDAETPVDLKAYSEQWVKTPHYPTVKATTFKPNPDGKEYAFFEMNAGQIDSLMSYWPTEHVATSRQSFLMTLNDNYLAGNIPSGKWLDFLTASIRTETDALTLSTLVSYLAAPLWETHDAERDSVEMTLLDVANGHAVESCRLQLTRFLIQNAASLKVTGKLYAMWRYFENELLSERDYMTMAYELAVRYPDLSEEILAEQRERLDNPDRLRQFDYISRAVSASDEARDSLFQWLLVPENRRVEPWAGSALYYLNHPLRDAASAKYIRPALEALRDVQRTGDIFFPSRWCSSLLVGHRSAEARHELEAFLNDHPDYPQLLKNKILVASFTLMRSKE